MEHTITVEKLVNPADIAQIDSVYYKTWLTTYPNKEIGITEEDIHELFKDDTNPTLLDEKIKRIQNFPPTVVFLVAKEKEKVVGLCMMIQKDTYNQLQ